MRTPESHEFSVVVTRPAGQADALCKKLEQQGSKVLRFPVIEIQPAINPQNLKAILSKLEDYDLAIFISANAVECGLSAVQHPWPASVPIAAIGQATAKALKQKGLTTNLLAPKPYNSESLLKLPELKTMDSQRIIVFRGVGGRETLARTLRERGAKVEYAECYRRSRPQSNAQVLDQAWEQKQTLLFVVTSNQGLQNLYDMVGSARQKNLLASLLVVMSERNLKKAKDLGFSQTPLLADTASDDGILKAINTWNTQDMGYEQRAD